MLGKGRGKKPAELENAFFKEDFIAFNMFCVEILSKDGH